MRERDHQPNETEQDGDRKTDGDQVELRRNSTQYAQSRIRGTEYSQVYLGSLTAILEQSTRFLLDKDKSLYEYQKLMERSEAGERNAIEGKFGEAKRRYGLGRVMAHLSDTSNTTIHLTILVMNLKKRARDLFDFIFHLLDCCASGGLVFKLALEQ